MEELDKAALENILNDTNFRFSDQYHYCSVLGKGAFGLVVEAVSKSTLENMAVKVLLLSTLQIIDKTLMGRIDLEKIKGEAEMLNSLDHPHIVKYKQVETRRTGSCGRVRTSCI